MLASNIYTALFACFLLIFKISAHSFTLHSNQWNLCDATKKCNNVSIPTGVYTALYQANLIDNPFESANDQKYRFISHLDWHFSTSFQLNRRNYTNSNHIFLVLNGIDTISNVFLNEKYIGSTNNMFLQYKFDVKDFAKVGQNDLRIEIYSSIAYSEREFQQYKTTYGYSVPPTCNPPSYNGECHVNFIRKMQVSYAWDWGPAFPSAAIYKPISIEMVQEHPVLYDFSAVPFLAHPNQWAIRLLLKIDKPDSFTYPVNIKITLGSHLLYEDLLQITGPDQTTHLLKNLPVNFQPKLWWPNAIVRTSPEDLELGYLYQLTVYWTPKGSSIEEQNILTKQIGFRTIELVQDKVPNGLSFQFRVNGETLFIRGTNLIPVSIFPEISPEDYIRHLLTSAKRAHMNMVRVWAGGIYQSDLFYEIADEMGIMIWQDFMFACALYPVDQPFIDSVQKEVVYQVERLQHHPSIAIWAGNNENEQAIAAKWWPEVGYNNKTLRKDYIKLYMSTIGKALKAVNPYAVWIPSTSSNGKRSYREGGIAKNPADPRFGDVHFYDYVSDPWDWRGYPKAKFVTEYGHQSFPSIGSLLEAFSPSELDFPPTGHLKARQHSPLGNERLMQLVSINFNLPKPGGQRELEQFIYLSQIHQAVAIKSQTEFYIRNRQLNMKTGEGLTYGAMFWQLNDVWQAPTWSSIEFGGQWKMLHYYMVKTFSPANAIGFIDYESGNLTVVMVNDYHNSVGIRIVGMVQRFSSLLPVTLFETNFLKASKGITVLFSEPLQSVLSKGWCASVEHCMVRFEIQHQISGKPDTVKTSDNFLLLSRPKHFRGLLLAQIGIKKLKKIGQFHGRNRFIIELETDHVALFVWLELDSSAKVRAIFSENGFMMLDKKKTVYLDMKKDLSSQHLQSILRVSDLLDHMSLD